MKKYIKFLSLICALVLSFSFLAVIGAAGGTGTEADPYIITTAQELQNINNNVTACYILGNDIDLAEMDFTPIGNADSGAFSGSFDGNGYKISGLNVFSGKYAGLFGSNEGVIKNVILDNIYVYGTRYVGGVVGQNTTCGTVENCTVLSGLVESDGGINDVNIGGICGINEGAFNGSFHNGAEVKASVKDINLYAGGICGYWNSSLTGGMQNLNNLGDVTISSSSTEYGPTVHSYSGGLVGYAYSVVAISNSCNKGNVSSSVKNGSIDYSGASYSGGLVGYASSTVTVRNSYNTGDISSTGVDWDCYSSSGGLVGYADSTVTISNSYNTGSIFSSKYSNYNTSYSGGLVGGITSGVNMTIIRSYNTGNVISRDYSGGLVGCCWGGFTITNCYNTGNIFSGGSYAGGLVGYTTNTTEKNITNSYNTGNVSCEGGYAAGLAYVNTPITIISSYTMIGCLVSPLEGKTKNGTFLTSNEMEMQLSYIGWDFEEIWTTDSNLNTGYPILKTPKSPLTLNICNKLMVVGETLQLIAYKNGVVSSDVIWSVSNGNSTVSSNGLVMTDTGLSTITVTDSEGNKANLNIYGYSPVISMSAEDRTINMTDSNCSNSFYFTINGSDTDYIVDYQSSDTSVVKVDEVSGVLTPVSAGTATITATTLGGATATQTVTVTAEAESLSLPSTLTVARGSTKNITATTTPDPTSSVITWTSSDISVATVDSNGNVTGLKSGTTIITATTDNGHTDTCTVTVNAPITEMAFETPSLTLYVGQEYKLKLNITPTDTTDTITYSTSSSTYASVTSAGRVTAKKAGTATITATSTSGKKAYCVVTVKAWPSVFTVVDSTTSIAENIITTDTTGVRNLEKLVSVKDGYNIEVTYSHQTNGLNYYGTGTTIDVYDDYGNFVITYTLVVNGDVNGDSFVDVLDATATERMSTDAMTYDEPQAYAANGAAIETVDATSYQYVLNKALAE